MNWSEQSQKQKQQEEHNLFDRWDKPPAAPIRRASETQNVFQDYQPRHNSTNDGWPDVSNRPNVSKYASCSITYNISSQTPQCHLVLMTFGASLPVHPQQSPQTKTPTESRPIHRTRQTRGSELIQALSNRAMVHHRHHHQVHVTRMMHSWCHLFQLSQHPLSRAIHC